MPNFNAVAPAPGGGPGSPDGKGDSLASVSMKTDRSSVKMDLSAFTNSKYSANDLTDEQVAEFKECFSLYDRDGDGTVDTQELGTVLRSLGHNPTEEELVQIITEVDDDRSGSIEFPEFLTLMARQMKADSDNPQLRYACDLLDPEGTGNLPMAELRVLLVNLCAGQLLEADINYILPDALADSDGRLPYEKLLKAFSIEREKE